MESANFRVETPEPPVDGFGVGAGFDCFGDDDRYMGRPGYVVVLTGDGVGGDRGF